MEAKATSTNLPVRQKIEKAPVYRYGFFRGQIHLNTTVRKTSKLVVVKVLEPLTSENALQSGDVTRRGALFSAQQHLQASALEG